MAESAKSNDDENAAGILAFSDGLRRVHMAIERFEHCSEINKKVTSELLLAKKSLVSTQQSLAQIILLMNPGPDFAELLLNTSQKNAR